MFHSILRLLLRRINSLIFRIIVLCKGGFIPLNCTIDIISLRSISVGHGFRLGINSRISVSHGAKLLLGSYVTTGHNFTLYCTLRVSIGDHCRIAHGVTIVDSKYLNPLASPRLYNQTESQPIIINSNTLIYTGAIVLLGVTIPHNSTVASYAIVHSGLDLKLPGLILGSRSQDEFRPYISS